MDSDFSPRRTSRLEILEMVCAVLIVFLIIALFAELFGNYPADSALILSIVTLILVCVLCLSFGGELRGRLKKLGPLELYEDKAKTIVESFNRHSLKVKANGSTGSRWEGLRRFQYEELDRLVFLVEVERQEPIEGELRRSFFKVLFQVGSAAAAQGEWTRAVKRLERLVELSRGQYEPASTFFNLGLSLLEWADSASEDSQEEPAREELLRKAVANLERACAHDPYDHSAQFWLAYALDEMGHYGSAIAANAAALRVRPQHAPSKYNAAVSSAKLKRFHSAFRRLRSISLEDELGKAALEQALEDPELEELRTHPEIGDEVVNFVRRQTGTAKMDGQKASGSNN